MRNRIRLFVAGMLVVGALELGGCEPADEQFDRRTSSLHRPVDVSCTADRRVFVTDSNSIVEVDLEDGSMRAVAQLDLFGDGPPLANPRALAVSPTGTHGYVVSQVVPRTGASDDRHLIMRIDLRTGDRTELGRFGTKDSVSLDGITDMIVTPDDTRLLLTVKDLGVVAFDIESRGLSILRARDPGVEDRGFTGTAEALTLSDTGELWIAQSGWSALFLLDADTGEMQQRFGFSGMAPVDIFFGAEPGQMLMLSSGTNRSIWNVNLATGEASRAFMDSPPFDLPMKFCLDHNGGRILVIDRGVLWEIDHIHGEYRDVLRWQSVCCTPDFDMLTVLRVARRTRGCLRG